MTTRRMLAIMTAALGVFVAASSLGDGKPSVVAIDAVSAVAVVLAWRGAMRQPARGRVAWSWAAIGLSLWLLGDLYWDGFRLTNGAAPTVSVADLAYIAGYPAFVTAIALMIRRRARSHWRSGLIDAVGVGLAAGLAAWVFLVPSIGNVPRLEQAITIAYPLADVVLLGALTWLILSPGIRGLPSALALGGIITTLALDITQSIGPITAHATLARWLDNAYPLAYLLLAFAACHERSGELTIPDPAPDDRLQPARIVFLGSALFAGPLIGTLSTSTNPPYRVAVMVTTIMIGTIVLYRFIGALREVERSRLAISHVAGTDSLTGVDNRRRFLESSGRVIERLHRTSEMVGALMIDIDHFKAINDTHGHAAGDAVLVELARRCNLAIRPNDLLGRIGGDEFAILLPGCGVAEITTVGERIVKLVRERPFMLPNSTTIDVTLSIGAAARPFGSVEDALAASDAALYEAKRRGRSRMWTATPDLARG